MKIVSLVMIALLFVCFATMLGLMIKNYNALSAFGVMDFRTMLSSQWNFLIIIVFDLLALLAGIFLHSQKKYLFNISLSLVAAVISIMSLF